MSQTLTENQKIHRALGYSVGSDLRMKSYSEDEVEQILAGVRLAASGDQPEYLDGFRDQAFQILNEKASRRAQERQDSEITVNKAAGEAFIKSLDGKEGILKSDSGLCYEILTEGSDKYATIADSVNVHYHGTLIDGTVFDSSVQRGEPVTFPLNGVVKGFSEGLTLVGEGGKIRLYMPSDIAYGDRGSGGAIGPGATLIFEVELLKINP
ncbi:MAG: FKBP-type peptidyl-prolyl cis-trans isomerase [Verrucomicrobia bacterium]|nr:FKBP-type peptidyl-prolyl cis-trans isomerase [Verrucomicrobiota bacterium]